MVLLFSTPLLAQTEKGDSLLKQFETRQSSQTANQFFALLQQEEVTDSLIRVPANTSSSYLCQQVWYWALEYYLSFQKYEEGTVYGEKALKLLRQDKDVVVLGDCLASLAICYFRMGDFDSAIVYAKQCNELDLKQGDPDNISSSCNLLAAIFISSRQYTEAEKYVLKALDYNSKTNNTSRQAILRGMACEVYNNMQQYDRAVAFGEQALKMEQQLKHPDKVAVRQSQLAESFIGMGRFDEAKDLLKEALPVLRKDKNRHSLGIASNQMGRLLLHDGNTEEAAVCFREALQIFLEQKDIFNESRSRRGLYEALRDTDPVEAMKHNDRYNQLRDSIFDSETGMLLSQYSAQLDNEHLQAEKDEMRQTQRRNVFITGAVLLLVALILSCVSYWTIRRHHKRIAELTGEISRIQQDMTDIKDITESKKLDFNEQQFLIEVMTLVNDSMASHEISVDDIAHKMGFTTSTFRRRLQQITGETPKSYISTIQMQKAATLLNSNQYSVNEVAQMCGFIETSNFTRTFKRVFGKTPSKYIQDRQNNEKTTETIGN